jgi:hypothetical protein
VYYYEANPLFSCGVTEQEISFRIKVINVLGCPGSHSQPKGRIYRLTYSSVSLVHVSCCWKSYLESCNLASRRIEIFICLRRNDVDGEEVTAFCGVCCVNRLCNNNNYVM